MSGLRQDGRFGLTWSRARHWHRGRGCSCSGLLDVATEHLAAAGFVWEDFGGWLLVEGPGLVDGDTRLLFEAVSGRAGHVFRPSARRVC